VTFVLAGQPGTTVSLLPIGGDVAGVTTDGLVYPLDDEPLLLGSARGVSNVMARPGASVTVRRGLLLVIGSPATL
jgi:thiamine pyrophosphokinase